MKLGEATDLASRNLVATYLALGTAVPGAKHYDTSGYDACVGDFPHPICNFGISGFWTETTVRNLCSLDDVRPPFNLYVLPGDRPLHLFLPWQDLGFQHTFSMCCMRCDPLLAPPARAVTEATTPKDRKAVSDFMSRQFFTYHASEAQDAVSAATADGDGLRLYSVEHRNHISAAVMIHRTEGCLGLYNLCVDGRDRRKGLGGSLVQWVLATAAKEGLAVTLQCDPKLERWYESFGFSTYGNLEVYTLAKNTAPDIMG